MKNKKTSKLAIIILAGIVTAIGLNLTTFAANDTHDPNKLNPASIDQIFTTTPTINNSANSAINNLPQVSMQSAITTIIKNILSFTFILTTLVLVVTGIYYLISEGNEQETEKAKKMLLYLVVGMAIIGAAYGIVSGITRFKLLE